MQGQTIDDIPMAVIEDAAQLCKANSIQVLMHSSYVHSYTLVVIHVIIGHSV